MHTRGRLMEHIILTRYKSFDMTGIYLLNYFRYATIRFDHFIY
jgi:hypothetical protein